MARPKFCVRGPWSTDPSRTDTLPRAEGQQVTATAHWPSTGSVKDDNQTDLVKKSTTPVVQDLHSPPRIQRLAVQVKAEQNCSPALGEKLSLETPISATISSTSSAAEGLQATAPAMWPSIPPAKKEHDFDAGGRISTPDMIQELQSALLSKTEPIHISASTSISTATVVKVEGVDEGTRSLTPSGGDSQGVSMSNKQKGKRETAIVGKEPRGERFKLSSADLVSDMHLRLKDKAKKLRVSVSLFKNRRRAEGLGRWPGRRVRAAMKREQAQAPARL